jgi:phage FluMu protein Com
MMTTLNTKATLKTECPKCKDTFASVKIREAHEKTCKGKAKTAPKAESKPKPQPKDTAPNVPEDTPTPAARAAVIESPKEPEPVAKASMPDTVTPVGVARTEQPPTPLPVDPPQVKAVTPPASNPAPVTTPPDVANKLAAADRRKKALMDHKEKKDSQTPTQNAIEEVGNLVAKVTRKQGQISHWSPAIKETLEAAGKALQNALEAIQVLPPETDSKQERSYKTVTYTTPIAVGDVVVVRAAFLSRYPASRKTMFGETGGTVLELEKADTGMFANVQFPNGEQTIAVKYLKHKGSTTEETPEAPSEPAQ